MADAGPLASVVIPCFNHGHFLAEAIDSALGQTYADVEVIVVDDGSTDDTRAVCTMFPQVTCIVQEHRGLPAARNAGIAACRGEYLVCLDADDRLLPHAVATGVAHLLARPDSAFVSGDHRYIDTAGRVTGEWARPPFEHDHYRALLRNNYIGMCATVVFNTALVRAAGGFDVHLRACEDYDLYLRLTRQHSAYSHHERVAEYRRYGTAMSDDPLRMLDAAVAVLLRQRPHVAGDAARRAALAEGLQHWRRYYGPPLAATIRTLWRTPGRRLDACRRALRLGRLAPGYLHEVWRAPAREDAVAERNEGVLS
jgi:glycosyltransferase involved in cell wall biosynthesis